MKTKDVDRLINKFFKNPYQSGWYGFRVTSELHSFGNSNMSPMSKQEYCDRIPKRNVTFRDLGKKSIVYKKGEKRPAYEPLRCSWKACPKLKEMFKKCGRGGMADTLV
jgi:hypothetical protein